MAINRFSWNVNGLRAAARKGFLDWLYTVRPMVLGVQETKCHPEVMGSDHCPVSLTLDLPLTERLLE